MQNIFKNLNTQQIEATTATEGYVRIIAGAGSGKTKTLTHRYAYLVNAAGIHPGNILCVTFTAKAAGEMKRRVRALVGEGCDNSLITTYHGFCVRVLREDIHRLLYPQSFGILDESDQKKILEEIYGELEIKLDRATFEKILDRIHKIKSDENYVMPLIQGDVQAVQVQGDDTEQEVIRRYLARQKKVFGLDFDDLIAFTFALFERYPETRDKWAQRLYYIEVDEFQDSSRRELRLLQILSAAHQNLFVVGDPDQNIYEWRGADVSILVKFDEQFPGAQTIFLNRNYRSSANILRVANTLIDHNQNRIKKSLYTTDPNGEAVIHCHAKSEREEGAFLTGEIVKLHKNGTDYKDMAILYRAGFLSRFVEQALMQANIPYTLYGSTRFYDRMEIRDAIAYLSLVNGDDDLALERVINVPKRQFGRAKLQNLKLLAANQGTTLWETLKQYQNQFATTKIMPLIETIEDLRARKNEMTPSAILDEVLTKSGYERYIRENGSMERLDNLAELKRTTVARERDWGEAYPLDLYLQQIAVESAEREEEPDAVRLMTIHAAKGLEFPVCFVTGMSEGIFPSARTLEERKEAGLEEERRLCFVALTRAMRRLYVTESEGTSIGQGKSAIKRPSRFLFEMGEENYTRVGTIPKELYPDEEKKGDNGNNDQNARAIGDVVQHAVFGRGIITGIAPQRRVYEILFENGAKRPVSMDYDFDAWNALAAMREEALRQAKDAENTPAQTHMLENVVCKTTEMETNEANKQENCTEQVAETIETDDTGDAEEDIVLPGQYTGGADAAESEMTIDGKRACAEKENTGNAPQLAIPFDTAVEIPKDGTEPVGEKSAEAEEEEVTPERELDAQMENTPISSRAEKEEKGKTEMPLRYRNAEWNRPPSDPGETNLWKRDDVPHEGWTCVDVIDLGAPVGTCRMCNNQIIRYVHVMRHPSYPRTIGAGCICAGRMEGNPDAARERENAFKNRLARRETFFALPRKKSRNGNEYVKYHGEIITLYPDKFRKGQWKAIFRGQYTNSCDTKEDALEEAFAILDPPILGK